MFYSSTTHVEEENSIAVIEETEPERIIHYPVIGHDHPYVTIEDDERSRRLIECSSKIKILQKQVERLSVSKFGIGRFQCSDDMMRYYTGFLSYELFNSIFKALSDCAESIILWSSMTTRAHCSNHF